MSDGSTNLVAWSRTCWLMRAVLYSSLLDVQCLPPSQRASIFMSAEQFSRLSLGEAMVTTRAGAAKAANASPPQSLHALPDLVPDHPIPSIEPPSPVSPTPSLVISTSNLQYNVSTFDTDLRRRAKRGLEDNDIRIKYCAVSNDEDSPDGTQTKYFYIDDDITVAMGGKVGRPKCTCGANEQGVACKVSPSFFPFLACIPAHASKAYLLGWRPDHLGLFESRAIA